MRAVLLGALPLVMGCGGPDLSEITDQEVSITVRGIASDTSVAGIGSADGGLAVERAFVASSALSLVPCLDDAATIVVGARGYDLLRDPAPSESVTTAVTQLCALQIDLDPVAKTRTPGVPEGATLYVESEDSGGRALSFTSERSKSLRFESEEPAGFPITPLLLGFDVSRWLTGLPLMDMEMSEAEAELFDSQLEGAVALYADTNGNGSLDDDENQALARAQMR